MNIYFVLHSEEGEIVGWQNVLPSAVDIPTDCQCSPIEIAEGRHFAPDPLWHRFDHLTGEIVDKSPIERAQSLLPKSFEVRSAISLELAATDGFVATDRPLSDELRARWAIYRQTLRDISKPQDERESLLSPPEMVRGWPLRPDGTDPVASLRARII